MTSRPMSARWRCMGDVLDAIERIDTDAAARAFLKRAQDEMPGVWEENIAYAFGRHIPESLGQEASDRIELRMRRAGWGRGADLGTIIREANHV